MTAINENVVELKADPAETYAALLGVVQSGKYALTDVCHAEGRVLFARGRSALSWGHFYSAWVRPSPTGTTLRLVVSGVPGAPRALLDGRKNLKAAEKVVTAVAEALAGATKVAATPVASFATLSDGSTVPWESGPHPEQR